MKQFMFCSSLFCFFINTNLVQFSYAQDDDKGGERGLALESKEASERTSIIKKFAPLVKFHHGENYFPSSVEWYLNRCQFKRYKDSNRKQVEMITEHPTVSDLVEHSEPSYFLSPSGGLVDRERTWNGEEIKDNHSSASCYAHWADKPQGAVIQYIFFYPYNGSHFSFLRPLEKFLFVGQHESDWEHIDVHLKLVSGDYQLDQIYFARHSWTRYGSFLDASKVELAEGSHPVVYSAFHGHASYGQPVYWISEAADRTSLIGPQWRCWEHVVSVGNLEDPTPGNEWIRFKGLWGDRGIDTPAQQGWWRNRPHQSPPVVELELTPDPAERLQKQFSLAGKIPTWIKKIKWKVNHPHPEKFTFSVWKRGYWTDTLVYDSIKGNGTVTPIANEKQNLYVKDLDGLNEQESNESLKLEIQAVEE